MGVDVKKALILLSAFILSIFNPPFANIVTGGSLSVNYLHNYQTCYCCGGLSSLLQVYHL